MREHLGYIWENWEDPKLKESSAIRELSTILQSELTGDSTSDEIRDHIRTHFQQPVFVSTGAVPATQWRQNAHGFTAFLMDDYRVLHVRYFSRDDRFLYADISMGTPKGSDLRHIDLTPAVDLTAFPASIPIDGESGSQGILTPSPHTTGHTGLPSSDSGHADLTSSDESRLHSDVL